MPAIASKYQQLGAKRAADQQLDGEPSAKLPSLPEWVFERALALHRSAELIEIKIGPSDGIISVMRREPAKLPHLQAYLGRLRHAARCKKGNCTFDRGQCEKRKAQLAHLMACGCVKNGCTRAHHGDHPCKGDAHIRCDRQSTKANNCALYVQLLAHSRKCNFAHCPLCLGGLIKSTDVEANVDKINQFAFESEQWKENIPFYPRAAPDSARTAPPDVEVVSQATVSTRRGRPARQSKRGPSGRNARNCPAPEVAPEVIELDVNTGMVHQNARPAAQLQRRPSARTTRSRPMEEARPQVVAQIPGQTMVQQNELQAVQQQRLPSAGITRNHPATEAFPHATVNDRSPRLLQSNDQQLVQYQDYSDGQMTQPINYDRNVAFNGMPNHGHCEPNGGFYGNNQPYNGMHGHQEVPMELEYTNIPTGPPPPYSHCTTAFHQSEVPNIPTNMPFHQSPMSNMQINGYPYPNQYQPNQYHQPQWDQQPLQQPYYGNGNHFTHL